ncbi:MAG: hypothetical protein JO021_25160 [Alphaproteobacteria bacterium]|nr:hypothetical protein [Alphaproteobacteria bacterium]
MTRAILTTLGLLLCAVDARAADEYVTANGKLMCTTQQSLREALKAIDTKDRALLHTVQGCRQSVGDVPAEILQDNVSMLKIRLLNDDRKEFWVLPDSVKQVRR